MMSFPRCPSPSANNRNNKLIKYEEKVEKCREEWTDTMEKNNFDLSPFFRYCGKHHPDAIQLLFEIIEKKIHCQEKELKKLKRKIDDKSKELDRMITKRQKK
jgi:hypothetical protein